MSVQSEATQTDLTLDPVELIAGDTVVASANVNPAGAEGEIEFTTGEDTVRVPVEGDGSASTELTASAAGPMTVTATFIPANPERYSSSSDSQTVDVNEQITTETNVTVDTDPARVGEEATLTANVTPSAADGTVTFTIGDQTYPVVVEDGTATLAHAFTETGQHDVTADFVPTDSARYTASTSQVTVNVDTETTQTALELDPVEVTAGGEVTATALVTPAEADGEVRFDYGDQSQTVQVTAGEATTTFTAEAAGTETVTATFLPADPARFSDSSDTQTVEITAEATSTEVTVDTDPARAGEETTLTATVTPAEADGTVTFAIDDQTFPATVENGTATLAHTFDTTGQHGVTADFAPTNPDRYAASNGQTTINVEAEATQTQLTLDSLEVTAGDTVSANAQVTPAGVEGEVEFAAGDQTVVAPVQADGSATAELNAPAVGTMNVTATFIPADTERYSESSDSQTVDVTIEATQTELTLDPVEVTAGDEVTATAQVTPADADGEVRFDYGDQSQTVQVTAGEATTTFTAETAGTGTITATFLPADTQRYSESSDTQAVEINAEATSTEVSVDTDPARAGEETTLTAIVTPAEADGTVTFTIDDQTYPVTVENGTATLAHTFTEAGQHDVTADFAPTDTNRYSASNGQAAVNVETEATQTDLTLDPLEVTVGGEITATAHITPAEADGEVLFEYYGQSETVPVNNGTAIATFTSQSGGSANITATFLPADAQRYSESSDSQSVPVAHIGTQTELSLAPDDVTVGDTVTATAQVTPAGTAGDVTFTVGETSVEVPVDADGTATAELEATTTGQMSINAHFMPTETHRYTMSSAEQTVDVTAEATQTELTLDPVEVTAGDEITATAQVTPADADGEVRFDYGDQSQTVQVTGGQASTTLTADAAGTGTVTATFLPTDAQRYSESSDTATVEVTVEQGSTTTELSIGTDPATAGEEATLTATVTPADADGTVTFTIGDQTYPVTVEGGVATLAHTFADTGEHDVTADFTPVDTDRFSASSDSVTVTVVEEDDDEPVEPVATTVTVDPVRAELGTPVTLVADVDPADAQGEVRFTIDGVQHTAPVVDGTATLALPAGEFDELGEQALLVEFLPADADAYETSSAETTVTVVEEDETDPGPDPSEPGTGSLGSVAIVGVIGSMIANSGSLGSLSSVGS